jgi:hypothetical protein
LTERNRVNPSPTAPFTLLARTYPFSALGLSLGEASRLSSRFLDVAD